MRTVSGLAIPTGVWTTISEWGDTFREMIEPGAVVSVVKNLPLVVDHGDGVDDVIARGDEVVLDEREDGYHVAARLAETPTAMAAWRHIRDGRIRGASFLFSTVGLEDEWEVREGVAHRRIARLGQLRDVSVVLWPSYPTTRLEAEEHEPGRMIRSRRSRWRG